jgi:hypothetical protein
VVDGGSSLGNITKGLLGFFPLVEKGFPRIFLVYFLHGYSSCDLGLM